MNYGDALYADLTAEHVLTQDATADASVGMVVKYVGDEASGTVTVTVTTGDITFQHGDLASEAVDDTIDSGGDDAGVIDVSDANANTWGEVVDLINASPNWSAYLVGVTRAGASGAGLLTKSETQAKVAAGIPLYLDESAALQVGVCISNKQFIQGGNSPELDDGWFHELHYLTWNATWATANAILNIYWVDPSTGTHTLKYTATHATSTTAETIAWKTTYGLPMRPPIGHFILVTIIGGSGGTLTAHNITVHGRRLKVGPSAY